MKIGDAVHIKASFEHGFGRYKGKIAKIVDQNPYHEHSWYIAILDSDSHVTTQINNVKEKDLELVWSVS